MIRQRSTGWAIHLGATDFEGRPAPGLLGKTPGPYTFRTRTKAREYLRQEKNWSYWLWPRARVVAVDITVKVRRAT